MALSGVPDLMELAADFKSTSVFDLFLLLFLREPGPGDIEGDKGRKKKTANLGTTL